MYSKGKWSTYNDFGNQMIAVDGVEIARVWSIHSRDDAVLMSSAAEMLELLEILVDDPSDNETLQKAKALIREIKYPSVATTF